MSNSTSLETSASRRQARRAYESDQPRERLDAQGPGALSDSELIALLLRTGSRGQDAWSLARTLLAAVGGLRALASTPASVLESVRGLGPAKTASLRAAIELGRRWAAEPIERGSPFCGPGDVQRHFEPRLRGLGRESFQALLLDGRHRLLSIDEVSVGTLTSSLVHPREVFREAIRSAAAAILLVHNHPSGDPAPSAEDRAVTRRLQAAGELVGIRVVDHVIVSEGGYYSFRESEGPGFDEAAAGMAPAHSERVMSHGECGEGRAAGRRSECQGKPRLKSRALGGR